MQSSKLIKLKKKLVLSGTYALLLAILILSISTARFADVRVAYSSYGAASFNSVILGDCTDGTLTAFGKTLNTDNCMPGMTYDADASVNTAKVIPFCIANGISQENASEASVSYTICLRTTKNLPLQFKLASLGANDSITYYQAGEPQLVVNNTENGKGSELKWYEWRFYVSSDEVNGETNEEQSEPSEAIFSLTGGSLSMINHQLIVEWPIENESEIRDNSTYYMKEVDLMEVLVTVSSKNNISDEYEEISYSTGDLYGKGIIIMDPSVGTDSSDTDYPYHYTYPVDLRAFHEVDSERVYDFIVSNGANFGIPQSKMYTDYVFELKVPYTVEITDSNGKTAQATKDFSYTFEMLDGDEYKEISPVGTPELRLYYEDRTADEDGEYKYGTYRTPTDEELADLEKWTKEESPERLYQVYRYETYDTGKTFRLENKAVDVSTATYVDRVASTDFRLVLTTPGDEPVSLELETAFENKLAILVRAKQTGDVPTVVDDAEEEAEEVSPSEAESENGGGV